MAVRELGCGGRKQGMGSGEIRRTEKEERKKRRAAIKRIVQQISYENDAFIGSAFLISRAVKSYSYPGYRESEQHQARRSFSTISKLLKMSQQRHSAVHRNEWLQGDDMQQKS
ncbi:hypothetical protein NDU88_006400 [Pleurodeles waltl]|uniref:MADS-box domain-containing protein n=1 Tax=Pleurodeles waltl TaxID=8319 RepID=A0AAV7VMN4_PLEWA|nr:hypothetical protein NDU88_006400 [Pleurodeles waltl]